MLRILKNIEINREEWSRLVRESRTGTWFQTPEAYEFFASQPELFHPFVVGIINNPAGTQTLLRGVCVGYVTIEQNAIKQFFSRRAIIIGGPALANDATDEEVEALMKAIRNLPSLQGGGGGRLLSPIYIETRNFNDYSRWKNAFEKAGFTYQPHLNFHVDCTDSETMFLRMSENRRRQIRKQLTQTRYESKDVTEQDIREWYEILEELYRTKVKTPLFPPEFFIQAFRQGIGHYMMVRHKGKIIGGSMVVTDGKAVYEWFECGLNAEYKEQYPSVMATYAGMRYATEQGIPRYDMMGAGVPGVPYGVRDFKAEFGGELVEHGRFLCMTKPFLFQIGRMGVKWLRRK